MDSASPRNTGTCRTQGGLVVERDRGIRRPTQAKALRRVAGLFAVLVLSACSTAQPILALHRAITGTGSIAGRVDLPGVSFVLPTGRSWWYLVVSTYQVALGAPGDSPEETWVIAESTYSLPSAMTPEQFLAHVKAGRADEPQTGRFETLSNTETLDTTRAEVCVKHRTVVKDFGAKRGADFTLVDYLGMNCIHPSAPKVGVFVELSRKAPTGANAAFDADGLRLLQSVTFGPFK